MAEPKVMSRATSALSMRKDVNVNYTELQDYDDLKKQPTHTGDPSTLRAWPTQPKPLVLARRDQLLYTALDFALIALPICLIIKTGLCIYAYNKDKGYTGIYIDSVSFMSKALIDLNSQLVTLFTIVFATIISIFVKRYALWKAQHGAYVADLEQIQGSVSLPSTLKLIWSLRSFGVRSIVLVALWSFYYLGSQAVKLEYRLTASKPYHLIDSAVSRPDAPSYFSPDLVTSLSDTSYNLSNFKNKRNLYQEILNTKFAAIVVDEINESDNGIQTTPGTKNGPLIPDYHTAVAEAGGLTKKFYHTTGGWIDVSKQSVQQYTSLTGRIVWLDLGYWFNGTYNNDPSAVSFLGSYTLYNISYLNISCNDPVVHPAWAFPNGTLGSWISFNMTTLRPNATRDSNGYPLREVDYWYKIFTADPIANSTSPYPTDYTGEYNTISAVQSTCNLTTKYVDMKVNCLTTGCYPSRLRWANNTQEINATGYSTPFDHDQFAANFLSNYTLSTGLQENLDSPNLLEGALGSSLSLNAALWSTPGPARFAYTYQSDYTMLNFTTIQDSCLTRGFNTYYMLSQSVISDDLGPNMLQIVDYNNIKHEDTLFKLIIVKGAQLDQGYRLRWEWIPVDFIACSILLAAAIGAYWLRLNTLAPDIFGYVSSLTRDNPHIRLPTEGSALSGVDRARMLKGVKVKIGDVQPGIAGENGIGRIGLAPVDADVKPLYRQQVYV